MQFSDSEIAEEDLRRLCQKWAISRLSLFGSALTGKLKPTSDIDLMVEFKPGERWSLMQLVQAEQEFAALFRRPVELVERKNLERSDNYIRRDAILRSAVSIYGT